MLVSDSLVRLTVCRATHDCSFYISNQSCLDFIRHYFNYFPMTAWASVN